MTKHGICPFPWRDWKQNRDTQPSILEPANPFLSSQTKFSSCHDSKYVAILIETDF